MVKKKGDRTELLTKEEMNRLILTSASNHYFFVLYNTLKYTGRRTGELCGAIRNKQLVGGVQVKDIDFENKTMETQILKTNKRKTVKTCIQCSAKMHKKTMFCSKCGTKLPETPIANLVYNEPDRRVISINDDLIPILQNFIKQEKLKDNDYLFRKYSLSCIKKVIKKHVTQAKIEKNFSLHGFRHYFITQCKRAGMNNEDIAKWTGHKNPLMLNIYDRRTAKDVEDKIFNIDL